MNNRNDQGENRFDVGIRPEVSPQAVAEARPTLLRPHKSLAWPYMLGNCSTRKETQEDSGRSLASYPIQNSEISVH